MSATSGTEVCEGIKPATLSSFTGTLCGRQLIFRRLSAGGLGVFFGLLSGDKRISASPDSRRNSGTSCAETKETAKNGSEETEEGEYSLLKQGGKSEPNAAGDWFDFGDEVDKDCNCSTQNYRRAAKPIKNFIHVFCTKERRGVNRPFWVKYHEDAACKSRWKRPPYRGWS